MSVKRDFTSKDLTLKFQVDLLKIAKTDEPMKWKILSRSNVFVSLFFGCLDMKKECLVVLVMLDGSK